MGFFLLLNTKYILKDVGKQTAIDYSIGKIPQKSMGTINSLALQNISFRVQQKNWTRTGLEQAEGEEMMTEV